MEAIGFIILGAGKPIVVCSVDWTGLLKRGAPGLAHSHSRGCRHDRGSSRDSSGSSTHAPFACLEAAKIVAAQKTLPSMLDVDFFQRCLDAARITVSQAMRGGERITHVASGQAKVLEVAANRRILGDNGKVRASRSSSCTEPELRALPEGLIDPYLKTIAFYAGQRKVAACHYYACHPMSYYGDGRASSDFCGLARKTKARRRTGFVRTSTFNAVVAISGQANTTMARGRNALFWLVAFTTACWRGKDTAIAPIESVSWKTSEILPDNRSALG